MLRTLMIMAVIAIAISCKKTQSDGIRPEDKEKAQQFLVALETNQYQLVRYYSETPIDYIDTDQVVKSETDLWIYVSEWLHDDTYEFDAAGNITIHQNEKKIPGNESATISKTYSVKADKNGVGFNFIGHEYQALKYRLISFDNTVVKVSASWNGKTVISEYEVLPN